MNTHSKPSLKTPVKTLSIVVPVYNEEKNIQAFYREAKKVLGGIPYEYELIFVNDGSTDGSLKELHALAAHDSHVRVLEFSRNFGKEIATTAGIHHTQGHAVIVIDADMQHPLDLIPAFVKTWEGGSEIVIGIRNKSRSDTMIKRGGSWLFYRIMNIISDTNVIPGETDYRLLDRKVISEFNKFTERSRLSRALVNWLGFKRDYIYFDAKDRQHGVSTFSFISLFRLAVSSFVSHSLLPLRLGGYLGAFITIIAGILGIVMFLDRYFFNWGLAFSGPAILANVILFLVGIILMAIGILAVYVGNIHQEVQNRPLYVLRDSEGK